MKWFKNIFRRKHKNEAEDFVEEFNDYQQSIRDAGTNNGRHYTDTPELVKQLKREGRFDEAIEILLESVELTEKESKFAGEGWGVAPWYYEQLAIIYRKQKRYDLEVAILERYSSQPKAPGVGPAKLSERLEKAKQLFEKSQA
ncbi:TPA: tetratricopeptide repeat protein [Vibrio parahaemolyticus]|uniref:tetratricopeptide repeat protein n=1 Tax=Vibrio TaxID=662 RepID=UPI001EEEF371|nr:MULTISPECIES: tetratricopeptide repeat protein [Vibrio]MDF4601134.1 tetratricopeptide repeat protein [Vibrio parahaemolyticus]MCS0298690.1 tetratricopeptide repeat protein [Vibrio alginolyticus]MDW1962287.1 tetratricopeptide repeat protein [Vibrio sp. 661]ULF95121.1 tetratricopeptide repeat protein [Vibrio alginolyticus]HCE1609397.1 tetratricopeptide repeat protein [Vibrio parahaemolyticus]